MGTLGSLLRSTRETNGIDLRDAAQRTRISIHYLKAIEDEAFQKLPGEVFVKGFLKNYARFLNLSETEVMERYQELRPRDPSPAPQQQPGVAPTEPASDHEKPAKTASTLPLEVFLWGAGIIIALIVFLFTALPRRAVQPGPGENVQATSEHPAQTADVRKQEKLYLEITALEDTWILVRTDASPQKKAVLRKGEAVTWSADDRFLLSYGSVGAAKLILNGKELTVNGPRSAVARDITITAAGIALQKIEQQPKTVAPRPKPQTAPPVEAQPAPAAAPAEPVQPSAPAAPQTPPAEPATVPPPG